MNDEERARKLLKAIWPARGYDADIKLIAAELTAVRAEERAKVMEEWRKGCAMNGTCIEIARARAVK